MIGYTPGARYPANLVVAGGFIAPGVLTMPSTGNFTSGTMAAARIYCFPLALAEAFVVSKAFWLNGATVGTDTIDLGVYRMTDLTTGRMDLIRSTGPVLSAGSTNAIQASSTWRVAMAAITSGSDSTDATGYTTASVTLKAGRMYLLSVENSHGSSAAVVSSITNGPTWTSRSSTQYNSSLNRVSIWSGVAATAYTGTLTINFGSTQTGCCWTLTEFSGVDTATNDGIVQQAVGTGNSGTALATLAAFASANNATFGAHGHAAATASAAGSGFTEVADVTAATPAQALCTDWRVDNDTTVDATFTSAQWGSCAVEIKADTTTPFVIPATAPGTSDIYQAFTVSGATATLFRANTSYLNYGGGLFVSSSPGGLPSSLIAASGGDRLLVGGFSSRTLL